VEGRQPLKAKRACSSVFVLSSFRLPRTFECSPACQRSERGVSFIDVDGLMQMSTLHHLCMYRLLACCTEIGEQGTKANQEVGESLTSPWTGNARLILSLLSFVQGTAHVMLEQYREAESTYLEGLGQDPMDQELQQKLRELKAFTDTLTYALPKLCCSILRSNAVSCWAILYDSNTKIQSLMVILVTTVTDSCA
jgi:hypothetical protein